MPNEFETAVELQGELREVALELHALAAERVSSILGQIPDAMDARGLATVPHNEFRVTPPTGYAVTFRNLGGDTLMQTYLGRAVLMHVDGEHEHWAALIPHPLEALDETGQLLGAANIKVGVSTYPLATVDEEAQFIEASPRVLRAIAQDMEKVNSRTTDTLKRSRNALLIARSEMGRTATEFEQSLIEFTVALALEAADKHHLLPAGHPTNEVGAESESEITTAEFVELETTHGDAPTAVAPTEEASPSTKGRRARSPKGAAAEPAPTSPSFEQSATKIVKALEGGGSLDATAVRYMLMDRETLDMPSLNQVQVLLAQMTNRGLVRRNDNQQWVSAAAAQLDADGPATSMLATGGPATTLPEDDSPVDPLPFPTQHQEQRELQAAECDVKEEITSPPARRSLKPWEHHRSSKAAIAARLAAVQELIANAPDGLTSAQAFEGMSSQHPEHRTTKLVMRNDLATLLENGVVVAHRLEGARGIQYVYELAPNPPAAELELTASESSIPGPGVEL